MAASKEEKKSELIDAIYKVNIHCQQCAREIKKPLCRAQGVHSVDVNSEKGEIKVKGVIDVIKVQKHIEKLSKKKVELISPKIKETIAVEKKEVKEVKKTVVRTTSVKINMHCEKCEHDLRQKLLKHKDIYSVKTDIKAQTLTIEGAMESEKLQSYLRKKVHQRAEIIPPKAEKKVEKEENIKEKVKEVSKTIEETKLIEFVTEKKVEVKSKEINTTPYFIHYVYAPQLFSDENPNACSIM